LIPLSPSTVILEHLYLVRGVVKRKGGSRGGPEEEKSEKKEKASDYFGQTRHGLIITAKKLKTGH